MYGSQGAIAKTWIGYTAIPLLPSVLSGSCLSMLSVIHVLCDLDTDVPNTCIRYVILVLHTNRCWMDLRFSEVASLFEKEVNDFEVCLYQPCLINKWNGPDRMEHPIGSTIIDFRINNNGSLPTRMRSLFSWNVNSWRTFNSNEYKLRRCKRLLRKGPVCLQETKWTGAEVEHLYQQIPGIRVSHSAAVRCGERARTGGVAVLLPPGWEILEELELVPGRAVAAKVQDRTCQFLLISVYIHPGTSETRCRSPSTSLEEIGPYQSICFPCGRFQWN